MQESAWPRLVTPISRRGFVASWARLLRWRALAAYLPAIVGLVVQVVLLVLAGELLDLYVSAVELWAELARKHLEIQLS